MKLNKIITMANKKVELEFIAMERSLRATGCKLPILVIPFNEELFELPEGSTWWIIPELQEWLTTQKAMSKLRKYQCFLTDNYQFVDSDVCFLRNPEDVLNPYEGFITSCLHWSNPEGTFTADSLQYMQKKTTIWPSMIFNSGQFACSKQLYTIESLIETATRKEFQYTCIHLWRDQPSINMLVFESGVKIQNLTLPPYNMQSTWVGDYKNDFENYWTDEDTKPYLMHWAGLKPSSDKSKRRKIDEIFFSQLTESEIDNWKQLETYRTKLERKNKTSIKFYARKVKKAINVLLN